MPKGTERSVKPPKEWWDRHYPQVKQSLKNAHPDLSDEQLEEKARASLGATWYKKMSVNKRKEERHKEGKEYGKASAAEKTLGLRFNLFKSRSSEEHYEAIHSDRVATMPAIMVDYYEKGKFIERKVCTAPMVLEEVANYDNNSFVFLIDAIVDDMRWTNASQQDIKKLNLVIDLATALRKRYKEQIAEWKKKKEAGEKVLLEESKPSNWQLKDEYFFGKSVFWLVDDEVDEEQGQEEESPAA